MGVCVLTIKTFETQRNRGNRGFWDCEAAYKAPSAGKVNG